MRTPGPFNSGIYPANCSPSGKKIWRRSKNSPAARQCQAIAGGFRIMNSTTWWHTWFHCEVTGEDTDRDGADGIDGPGAGNLRTDPPRGAGTIELAEVLGQLWRAPVLRTRSATAS